MEQLVINCAAMLTVAIAAIARFGFLSGLGITAAVYLLAPYHPRAGGG